MSVIPVYDDLGPSVTILSSNLRYLQQKLCFYLIVNSSQPLYMGTVSVCEFQMLVYPCVCVYDLVC